MTVERAPARARRAALAWLAAASRLLGPGASGPWWRSACVRDEWLAVDSPTRAAVTTSTAGRPSSVEVGLEEVTPTMS